MTNHITERNGKRILSPTDEQLAAAIRQPPPGESSDLGDIRAAMATQAGVDITCPVTVQRLLVQFSEHSDVPYRRVLDASTPFARRLAGGTDRARAMLDAGR